MSGCAAPGETFQYASPAEALAAILPLLAPIPDESIPLDASSGRILAQPILADRDSPAADVSAMDGYALRLPIPHSSPIPIAAESRIGRPPPPMPATGVVRIVTGAPVPAGADAVIKREDTTEHSGHILLSPSAAASLKPGLHIRRRAENLRQGQEVAPARTLITPPIAAALATFGFTTVRVRRPMRIGLLTTGDEVRAPHEHPTDFELRDSHGSALRTLLAARPWTTLLPQRREPDDPARLLAAATSLLESADLLLLTGGVSMGQRDFVPSTLAALHARTIFHRIPQRPGKPILAAILPDGRPILGLPGNPLSVMVTARRFAIPVMETLAGLDRPRAAPSLVHLDSPGGKLIDLWWHRLVRLTAPGRAEPVDNMGSGDIPAAARSDGFVEIPPGDRGPGPWPFYGWC